MKKILLIFLFLSAGLFGKSPYSLEQITKHLEGIYQFQLKQNATLKKWVEDEIIYSTMVSKSLSYKKNILNNKLREPLKITTIHRRGDFG